MRATGYIADPQNYRRARYRAAREGITSLPKSASIIHYAPETFDQNQTGSCTGATVASCIATALNVKGEPLPWVPSPKGIYTMGRAIDRDRNPDDTLQPLTDSGAQPNQVMRGITEWGIRPMGPLMQGFYDCDPSNVNEELTLDELEQDALFTILGEYAIYSRGEQRIVDLCTAIVSGKPVAVAIAGSSPTFQHYTTGILPKLEYPNDHYVWLGGFTTDTSGRKIFRGRNSWGAAWGENGNFRLNEDAVQELEDLVAMDVHVKKV